MLKLLKYLKKTDWIMIVLILGLTVLQVYCTMTLMNYISSITESIQYVYLKNHLDTLSATMGSGAVPSSHIDPAQMADMMNRIQNASTGDIWYNGGMMILVATGMIACQAMISVMASYISAHLATRIRKALNDKVTSFSLAEINRFSTESLITRTTDDVQMYQMTILLTLRMFFAAPATAIWAICKIQSISWTLMIPALVGILALVVGLVLMLVLVFPKFKLAQKLLDRINGQTRENVNGIRVVHAYNAEEYQEKKFGKTNDELTKTQLFTGRAMALLSPYITLIMNVVSLLVYWIGASLINDGTTDYAQVLSMMMLSTQIVMSFMMLIMMFFMIRKRNKRDRMEKEKTRGVELL